MIPNPCCCNSCTEMTDAFSGGSLDTGKFELIDGSATLSSGYIEMAADSQVLALQSSSDGTGRLLTDVYFDADGDQAKIWFAYLDANNHWRIDIEYMADSDTFGEASVVRVSGGVETTLGPVLVMRADAGSTNRLRVEACWKDQGGTIRVSFSKVDSFSDTGTNLAEWIWVNHVSGGGRAGFGSGNVVSSVKYDSFLLSNSILLGSPCTCLTSNCTVCTSADFSGDWLVEDISGPHPGSSAVISCVHNEALIENRFRALNGRPGTNYFESQGFAPGETGLPYRVTITYCLDQSAGTGVLFTINGFCGGSPNPNAGHGGGPGSITDCAATWSVNPNNNTCTNPNLGVFDITPI